MAGTVLAKENATPGNTPARQPNAKGCIPDPFQPTQPTILSAMKTKLMLVVVLASAAVAQATPPITPAKAKAPLHLSQLKGVFHRVAQKPSAAPVAANAHKVAAATPFPNHPETAPGPH